MQKFVFFSKIFIERRVSESSSANREMPMRWSHTQSKSVKETLNLGNGGSANTASPSVDENMKSASENEGSIISYTQSTVDSQRVEEKIGNNPHKRQSRKRIFRDSVKELDIGVYAKKANFSTRVIF